jgi:hypothetical protein
MNASLAGRVTAAMALLATAGLPSVAAAQYRLPSIVSTVKADSLTAAAVKLVTAGRWRDAARLYRTSAQFRPVEDSVGFQCLTNAADLAYAAGDHSAARGDMANAAERALARGDLRAAALAYLDAAWIAQEQRKPNEVWQYGHRAEILAASPLISQSDRWSILQRIERPQLTLRYSGAGAGR